ncbi:MAG: polysaccharide deacetylase family protein [Oscillochloridaceae bacterium]|nr:polysaccharide deacetylase family protein [Chloroflexaceae bacterium]MDW8391942.1 polysaccharide deacetylase family protein [Oscillochloridaceae bacterium]
MKLFLPVILGLILAAALVLISQRTPDRRIAPAGAVGGVEGFRLAGGTREPLAPPPSAPLPTLVPVALRGFTPALPGERPYVPILMYHYVRHVDRAADPLGFSLSVTPEQLDAQLGWLKAAGYETVRMDALAACMRGAGPCPLRAVALTFDDGYADAFTAALPILRRHGFVATFYIVSGFVGQPGYMNWGEIRALRDAGMEIGAHSISHPDLTGLGLEEIRAQVGQSGAVIAAEIGQPVLSFCYPGGRFNDTVVAVTREAGYTSATTTIQDGPQSDPFTLPRLRISGDTTLEGFQWMVAAYLP